MARRKEDTTTRHVKAPVKDYPALGELANAGYVTYRSEGGGYISNYFQGVMELFLIGSTKCQITYVMRGVYEDISSLIEKMTKLQADGFQNVEADTYEEYYDSKYAQLEFNGIYTLTPEQQAEAALLVAAYETSVRIQQREAKERRIKDALAVLKSEGYSI